MQEISINLTRQDVTNLHRALWCVKRDCVATYYKTIEKMYPAAAALLMLCYHDIITRPLRPEVTFQFSEKEVDELSECIQKMPKIEAATPLLLAFVAKLQARIITSPKIQL